MSESKKAEVAGRIKKALESDCPRIYFNGFVNSIGSGDILIIAERNGQPVAVLNTSYTVAKSLSLMLNDLIQNLEGKMGVKIMTTKDTEAKLFASAEEGKE